ncbi:MAG: hypothetical protein ABSG86_28175 [Thermoguttaceae bacterium]|jgi:hypothetical protein
MGIFGDLFGKQPSKTGKQERSPQEAVLVYLDGAGLPDHVYEECDTSTIEDRLIDAVARDGLGEFDGNEVGPTETTLFLYGPDAEKLFAGIEVTLRGYPLCQGARVVIRHGGPGSPQREVKL